MLLSFQANSQVQNHESHIYFDVTHLKVQLIKLLARLFNGVGSRAILLAPEGVIRLRDTPVTGLVAFGLIVQLPSV